MSDDHTAGNKSEEPLALAELVVVTMIVCCSICSWCCITFFITRPDRRLMPKECASNEASTAVGGASSSNAAPATEQITLPMKRPLSVKLAPVLALIANTIASYLVTHAPSAGASSEHRHEVVVMISELACFLLCLGVIVFQADAPCDVLYDELWLKRRECVKMGIPALCYAMQEKMQDLAAKHLSAAGLQEVGQFKVFAAALFSIAVLRRRYSRSDWFSFVTLVLGVILTQSQAAELVEPDGNVPANTKKQVALGIIAGSIAALVSSFAGVFLELMYANDEPGIVIRILQLCIFAIPLQMFSLVQGVASRPTEGLLVAFSLSTWVLIGLSIAGIFLSAIVLKRAGNITVIFASSVAWITSCIVSVPWLGLYEIATPIFWLGVVLIALATFVYEGLRPLLEGVRKKRLKWIRNFARLDEDDEDDEDEEDGVKRRRRQRRPSSLGIEMDAADGGCSACTIPNAADQNDGLSSTERSIRDSVAGLDSCTSMLSARGTVGSSPPAPSVLALGLD